MKARNVFIAGCVLVLASLSMWIFNIFIIDHTNDSNNVQKTYAESVKKLPGNTDQQLSGLQKDTSKKELSGLDNRTPKSTQKIEKLASMLGVSIAQADNYWDGLREAESEAKIANVEIEFYGKVVDQSGDPVPGAKVSFSVYVNNENLVSQLLTLGYGNVAPAESKVTEVQTDEQGLFSVSGVRGEHATVENIEKLGYLFHSRKSYQYSRNRPESFRQTTVESPAVFVMWKQDETEALIKSKYRGGLDTQKTNEPVIVHFVRFPNNPGYNEEGDFRITAYDQGRGRDERNRPIRRTYDWWVDIEAVDGGIIRTEDVWLYKAPTEGYKKSLRIEGNSSDPDWDLSIRDMKIYFKSHGNYGSAKLDINAEANGKVGVYMRDVLINPTGSTNLEYDPMKEIKIKYK